MRFNRIRLNGFKSFVDPTDLVIAEGLTGVVGPNGCGKSNLLEAIRWVMGENRPTAMRGAGMEDVIFAGASSRPARHFAEVTLQLDNADRLAPAGFNDHDQLEVVRRITRDAGSAYKVNGKDIRARDVQMLFADAATGATSPALVRQGQISELINAKPRARRRILEDAAGIAGLYQRRHEAELKLKSTETNLERVDDVLERLGQQLHQLDRQAKQAARYRTIGEALRRTEGLLLYRRWREAEDLRQSADVAYREASLAAARAEKSALEAQETRSAAEEMLPPLREEDSIASALLQRLLVERDTLAGEEARALEAVETLSRRIEQLTRDMDRESGLNRDAEETLEKLEEEALALQAAAEGHDDALEEALEIAEEATEVLHTQEAALAERTEEVARLSARHQTAQRGIQEAERSLTRAEADAARAQEALDAARATQTSSHEAAEAATERLEEAEARAEHAESALAEAESARAEARSAEADARALLSEAEGAVKAIAAEVAALSRLLDRDQGSDGQVLDQLTVTPGFEKALGAALGDDLRAPVIDDPQGPAGWRALPAYHGVDGLPDGLPSLAAEVSAPPALARRLGRIGLVEDTAQGALLHEALRPGQRLVTREGDLWRWDGYRARAEDQPSAAALRLEQMNRLAALREDLEEAEARQDEAQAAHEDVALALAAATRADEAAREARRSADAALTAATRDLSRAEADRDMAEGRLDTATRAATRHAEEIRTARVHLSEARAMLAELADLDAARAGIDDLRLTVEAARLTMLTRRSAYDELRRDGEARVTRQQRVTRDLDSWRRRLSSAEGQLTDLAQRKAKAEADLATAKQVPGTLSDRRDTLLAQIDTAEERKAAAIEALHAAEGALRTATAAERDAERLAGEAREARAATQARAEAAREAVEAAAERIHEELELTPQALLESLEDDPDEMLSADRIEAEVQRLKRARDALGAVNLRAEEDANAVREERDTLAHEKEDLEAAVATLRGGIASLNREGRERLLTAFEQVNASFKLLFTHLFRGGEADLVMVESDDPLEAGLEIMCQPPGKKLSVLSLLSGGEQTLTALALIFAVFLANPAPICVLDEVDAPLDDANVTRFCDMLDEMCRQTDTRFLIITHHAVTMSRMDRLFGVTMQEQGVSQLVSVDLKKAEAMVA